MASQLSLKGLYLAPVLVLLIPVLPPHTIISFPDQTAVWLFRPAGAPMRFVVVHELERGL